MTIMTIKFASEVAFATVPTNFHLQYFAVNGRVAASYATVCCTYIISYAISILTIFLSGWSNSSFSTEIWKWRTLSNEVKWNITSYSFH